MSKMGLGVMLFMEALVAIDQQENRKLYEITQCAKCGHDVQLEQSNDVCWHCVDSPPKESAQLGLRRTGYTSCAACGETTAEFLCKKCWRKLSARP